MKKTLLLLAMLLAFTLTSVAQTSSSSSMGQSDQTTTPKKSKKSAASSDQTGATSDTGTKTGTAKKEATVTGCLSSDASTISNGHYKKGVKVEPADKVKDHAGHQVQLTGEWKGTGADKTFEVASLKHISDTCKAAPGGATTGTTKKGEKDMKKGKDTGATPPQS
jgi:hypothetical protein